MFRLILTMLAGMAVGTLFLKSGKSDRMSAIVSALTTISIQVLLFLLGTELGSNPSLLSGLGSIGLQALLIAVAGVFGSMCAGWLVFRFFPLEGLSPFDTSSGKFSLKDYSFSLMTLVSLLAGVLLAYFNPTDFSFQGTADPAMILLYVLLASVGLGLGLNPELGKVLKNMKFSLLLLPLCSIAFTLLMCALASPLLKDRSIWDTLAVGSGFGYYSLSSVLIANCREGVYGAVLAAELGAVALISNVLRELITLIGTPFMHRYFGPFAPVAASGATAMDVCLPGLIRSCGQGIIPAALVSGVITDFSVPFIVTFFCSL